ncbi:hypothetical protein CPT_Machias_097 [Staphylococcus phage Machias]|nr:hypothetical protein CPT_Machias_097 [Staphylococcus phage Machias]WPH64079.1 hypothetical protein [Staphylococcus phage vB_StaM_PB50]
MTSEKKIASELTLDQKIKLLEPKIQEESYLRPLSQVDESFYNEVIKDELMDQINKENHKFENSFDYHIFKNGPIQLMGFIYKFEFNEQDLKVKKEKPREENIYFGSFLLNNKNKKDDPIYLLQVDSSLVDFSLIENKKYKEFGRNLFKLIK